MKPPVRDVLRVSQASFAALLLSASPVFAQGHSEEELAKQLNNPVASLISVPLQFNYDCCFGSENGARYTLNVQPVIPLSLNDNWNLIVRTIVPIVYQESPEAFISDNGGFADITQSFFLSPKESHGFIWAVGPVFVWPIGESEFSARKWDAGPTALVLKQSGQTTYGVLANHVWSYAGDEDRPDVSASFVQPFFSFTQPNSTTYSINMEASYDWAAEEWTAPMNFGVSHVYDFSGQRVSLGAQGKVYLLRDDEPDWGLRAVVTFLFPKG